MARPEKKGLDYFPMDTDMFSDIKLRKLIRCQGGKAVTVYVCLLCIIYESGYYILWDEDLLFIVSERTGYEEAYIREVLRSCLAVGLFDRAMWTDGVLTSRGIQCRYTEVSSRRKGSIKEYSLINATETHINATETHINATETPQRKEKKSKGKDVDVVVTRTREDGYNDFLKAFFADTNEYQIETLLMQMHCDRDTLERAARETISEWQLTQQAHDGYSDMARHLINQMRKKIIYNKEHGKHQRKDGRAADRRTGAGIAAATAEDYKTAF